MRLGIPESLLFYRYERIIRMFFKQLDIEVIYSGNTNRDILERGLKSCVDEACLPMKVFHGHVSRLKEECDRVVVPRLMKCEYGESICPKFAGLPEMIKSSMNIETAFTSPLYLDNSKRLLNTLIKDGQALGLSKNSIAKAYKDTEELIRNTNSQIVRQTDANRINVALLGHPYNIEDNFVNLNLKHRLKQLDMNVITGDGFDRAEMDKQLCGLMKKPYWMFYRENFCKAGVLAERMSVDGIIYISSFCCGTDSVTVEMIRNRIGDLPMLVLKLDEHTGEAGFQTRIEAFAELLERRRIHGNNLSQIRRQPYLRQAPIPGNRSEVYLSGEK